MRIYSKQKQSLKEVKVIPFQLEREIQSLVENNLDELFGYSLIQSEFTLGLLTGAFLFIKETPFLLYNNL